MLRVADSEAPSAEILLTVIYDLQRDIRGRTAGLAYAGCDSLAEAYVCCLEAANGIGLAMEQRAGGAHAALGATQREALGAARAAVGAITFSLVQVSDSARTLRKSRQDTTSAYEAARKALLPMRRSAGDGSGVPADRI